MSEYKGWTLFDNVIIVAKRETKWDWKERKRVEGELQGYIVDPSNKSMLESAINWGTETRRLDKKDENGRYLYEKTEPAQYTFENKGFTLQLLDSAEGSSQGGKLSFWNCLIIKGDYKFKVGIAANLLLELLKQSTFTNGVCQHEVFFARCKGGVGMLHEDMDSYKEAVSDMQKKQDVKSAKKTSKWEPGCNYATLQCDSMCIAKINRWVELIWDTRLIGYWGARTNIVTGVRILSKPIKQTLVCDTSSVFGKVSSYFKEDDLHCWGTVYDKCPSRPRGKFTIEVDMTPEEMDEKFDKYAYCSVLKSNEYREQRKDSYVTHLPDKYLGITATDKKWVMPQDMRQLLTKMGLEIVEE